MARPVPQGGKREVQVLVRLNEKEVRRIDALRANKSRAEYLRWKALRPL